MPTKNLFNSLEIRHDLFIGTMVLDHTFKAQIPVSFGKHKFGDVYIVLIFNTLIVQQKFNERITQLNVVECHIKIRLNVDLTRHNCLCLIISCIIKLITGPRVYINKTVIIFPYLISRRYG